jgi:hypothetical protein
MCRMGIRKNFIAVAAFALSCCLFCTTQAGAADAKYMWCKASEVGGSRVFYSDPFAGSDDKSLAEYDTAFDDFVRSH